MKISELPEPYKTMAEENRKKQLGLLDDYLGTAFRWEVTRQGRTFWSLVRAAKKAKHLPKIRKYKWQYFIDAYEGETLLAAAIVIAGLSYLIFCTPWN